MLKESVLTNFCYSILLWKCGHVFICEIGVISSVTEAGRNMAIGVI